ncbi:MAG: prepilin peptidase [Planctomycetes bacterium]|nr:prepilin peptidase [Planctomycetota bacterium]
MGELVAMGLLCAVVLPAAVIDIRTQLTPNYLTLPAILAGLIWATVFGAIQGGGPGALTGLGASLAGLGAGLIPFALIYACGGMGGGDVKLMAAVGAITASWQVIVSTTFYAFLFGALMAIFVMIRRGLIKRTLSRIFGAALMTAAKVKPQLPDDSPRIPFAVAIALGSILAASEILLNVHTPWRGL